LLIRPVAEKVINLAQRGIRDPDVLRTMTLKEFGSNDGNASRNRDFDGFG